MAKRTEVVFLTGATGFVGRHVAAALVGAGYDVKALVRPRPSGNGVSISDRLPGGLRDRVTAVVGDVLEAGYLVESLRGCRYLVHCAALYSFAPIDRKRSRDVNVRGTASLLEAARLAGVEKVVVTSSSATVGPAPPGRPATEQDWAPNHGRGSAYHRSKIEQERVALAAQIPTVLLLPTAPVGTGDARPTPTGRMILDFMRGRIVATLPGGLNVVPVEDVARAHVAAISKGRAGERYLIGGSNLTLRELFGLLATITGRRVPTREIPFALALALGYADELRCRLRPMDTPMVPLEGVYMGRERMFVSSRKAEEELRIVPGPVTEALRSAVTWFRSNGHA